MIYIHKAQMVFPFMAGSLSLVEVVKSRAMA